MGDGEAGASASVESPVEYHPPSAEVLTTNREPGSGTVSGGQFDWGGCLLNGSGGAQRFPQRGWKSRVECKGIREPDCETDVSSRDESRA